MTEQEQAYRFMQDILREPDCCDPDLVVLAERFDKAVALLRNVNDLFCEHPLPESETIAEEVREFFGLPV